MLAKVSSEVKSFQYFEIKKNGHLQQNIYLLTKVQLRGQKLLVPCDEKNPGHLKQKINSLAKVSSEAKSFHYLEMKKNPDI